MKFEWKQTSDNLQCLYHQEAFVMDMIDRYNLTDCNKSPHMLPFKRGLPVDTIPPSTLSTEDQSQVTKKYQQLMGDLNWLSISTRINITSIHLILSAYSHKPSREHLGSALQVVRYCASNPSHGLLLSHKHSSSLEAFLHFPVPQDLTGFSDANWGPMDSLVPKKDTTPPEQSLICLRSISGWIVTNHGTPVTWGCLRHKDTAQNSCQAEVHSINEVTKVLLSLKLFFRDIALR